MSDLASLMKYAPGTAGFMIGQNNGQARQSEALRQQELKQLIAQRLQQMEQEKMMNPLKMEHQSLQNQGLAAGLPGISADSELKGLSAQFTRDTQPQAIEAKNSASGAAMDKDKYEVANRFRDWAMETGVSLEAVPPPARKAALVERMQASKINPNNPMAQRMLSELDNVDPAQWPSHFMKLSDKLGKMTANMNPQYRSSVENSERTLEGTKYTANAHERASKYTADKSAESRIESAKIRGPAKGAAGTDFWTSYYKTKGALSKYNALTSEAAKLLQGDEDDKAEAQKLITMREALREEAEAELNMRRNPSAVDPNAFVAGSGAAPLSLGGGGPKPAGAAQVGPNGKPPIVLK